MKKYEGMPSHLIEAIDGVVKLSKSTSGNDNPTTKKDWETVVEMYKLWRTFFPDHYKQFIKTTAKTRDAHILSKGISKDGDSFLQHRLELPQMLDHMLRLLFPKLKYTSDFVTKFLKELPEFKQS